MKSFRLIIVSFLIFSHAFAQENPLKVEDIFASRQFVASTVRGFKPMNDGHHFTMVAFNASVSANDIIRYDYKSGDLKDTLVKGINLIWQDAPLKWSEYKFDRGETQLLLATAQEQIYRHSTRSDYFIYDLRKKSLKPVSEKGKQMYATFSPDGNKVAFVRDNNIFVKDLYNDKETQITFDGRQNEIINGSCDWVYEEEFAFARAFQWSPDGKRIAYYKFNESNVREFSLTFYNKDSLYPREEKYKYPKAGEENSLVSIYLYDLLTGKTTRAGTGSEKDSYIPRIRWTANPSVLCIMRMNRHQNKLELLSCDAATGICLPFYTENNERYIDIEINDNLYFTSDNRYFIWLKPYQGFTHIFKLDLKGNTVKQITKGEYDVTDFYGYDEATGVFYYRSTEISPMDRQVYSITEKGKKTLLSRPTGTNKAEFSSGFKYFINTWSDANTPYLCELYTGSGKIVRVLETNAVLLETMSRYKLSRKTFFKFKTTEGVELNGWMIKPPDFIPARKYPVFQYMYGGNGSNTVNNSWEGSNYFFWQLLAQKGYIIVSVDNRGTDARGEEFQKCTYLNLGKLETIDQIEVAKHLGTLDYIDKDRIGVFGWSFGGYLTSMLMTKGADYFKMGIAVAPVTSWRYYDTIYTERYLRTPQENKDGYDDNSPINFADKLKGKFLLVHGMTDDNVHLQNSVDFISALLKANKQFETLFYPNSNHNLSGFRLNLYTRMENFILNNL
ncbi:MAG: S9 family peptidase [Bacteroidia bacterium]|nr:S9 family peptidase [Bacteroidia bacterium]